MGRDTGNDLYDTPRRRVRRRELPARPQRRIATAVGATLVITAVRLVRKEPLGPALNGLSGVAVAAVVSWWTGSAKNYHLLGIWLSALWQTASRSKPAVRVIIRTGMPVRS